jgi:hypothetical protein
MERHRAANHTDVDVCLVPLGVEPDELAGLRALLMGAPRRKTRGRALLDLRNGSSDWVNASRVRGKEKEIKYKN